ncbi:hypothetical protein JTE90_023941 [Oedothorax gibbosus]|uniref:Uncharacterized protein n=1 Tax=Oedothorax gibbosus TaxID=931172 RepID=A0AAV6USL9_9ARAC|nr:hypothetical protein JTE90_023941 [Oedothorax gibbosus]
MLPRTFLSMDENTSGRAFLPSQNKTKTKKSCFLERDKRSIRSCSSCQIASVQFDIHASAAQEFFVLDRSNNPFFCPIKTSSRFCNTQEESELVFCSVLWQFYCDREI